MDSAEISTGLCGLLERASSAFDVSPKMFLVLSLVAACCIVMLTRDLVTAGLIIATISALFMMSFNDETSAADEFDAGVPAADVTADAEPLPNADPADMYGPYYDMWHQNRAAYTECYPAARAPAVAMMADDVDSGMAMIGIDRARDKKCIEGWVARDANYYKHHFGTEFEESEARPWWGRHEY